VKNYITSLYSTSLYQELYHFAITSMEVITFLGNDWV